MLTVGNKQTWRPAHAGVIVRHRVVELLSQLRMLRRITLALRFDARVSCVDLQHQQDVVVQSGCHSLPLCLLALLGADPYPLECMILPVPPHSVAIAGNTVSSLSGRKQCAGRGRSAPIPGHRGTENAPGPEMPTRNLEVDGAIARHSSGAT